MDRTRSREEARKFPMNFDLKTDFGEFWKKIMPTFVRERVMF